MAKYRITPSSRTIVQSPISIGHKAEKGVEAIEFDLTAWVETYGSGTATIVMKRWGDSIPYPVALEIDENNKATWTLSDIDTAKAGMAYAQLNYIVGDEVVKKSDIYTFRVMDSLTGEGEPPEAYESWLEHLTHLAAEAMAEVLDIEGIVTDKTLTIDGGIADAKATGDALALKADKSTTYTKTEVDQMIEDVEIETDTTLTIEGAAADAAETGRQIDLLKADLDAVDSSIGEPYEILEPIEYTIINGKKFNNRDAGNTMNFTDNTTYHYILLSVSEGEKYNVKTYFTSANTYYIYMCDSNGIIVSRGHNATGQSGSQTFDIEIPANIAQLYIQGYSSASAIANRMDVQKYISYSFRDVLDTTNADLSAEKQTVSNIENGLMAKSNDYVNLSFAYGRMNIDDGSVNTSNHNYAFSRGIQICHPVTISITGDDYGFAVNQYYSYNYSSTYFVKNWKRYDKNSILIYADAYPIYIKIGAYKNGGVELTSEDLANIESALSFNSLNDYPMFASIAMFNKFAVTGCSWDAGTAYNTLDGHVTHTGIGWAETLGRRNGCQVGNFAIGGSNIRSWFNTENHASSFKSLLLADAYPLYILTEGNSNDANAFVVNDSSYSAETPSEMTYYVGTIEDISTREDYHDYPCTFYGYYGRVIEMIQEHAPGTRIIISSPDTTAITTDIRKALRTACKNIATYYNLPYMDIEKDPYYDVYVNALVGNHPSAPTYSGWAMAIERQFSECVKNNLPYFQLYSGLAITPAEVAWEAVSLE